MEGPPISAPPEPQQSQSQGLSNGLRSRAQSLVRGRRPSAPAPFQPDSRIAERPPDLPTTVNTNGTTRPSDELRRDAIHTSHVQRQQSVSHLRKTSSNLTPTLHHSRSGSAVRSPALMNMNKSRSQPQRPTGALTVNEYAVEQLFANYRIRVTAMTEAADSNILIQELCGPGADVDFDNLINAMTSLVRDEPRQLVDLAMKLRNESGKKFTDLEQRLEVLQSKKRNEYGMVSTILDLEIAQVCEILQKSERSLFINIYLLCRIIINVYQNCPADRIATSMDDSLQQLIFQRLLSLEANKMDEQAFQTILSIYSEVLATMARRNFTGISRRYIKYLSGPDPESATRSKPEQSNLPDSSARLLLHALQYLHLPKPDDPTWSQSFDLIYELTRLLQKTTVPSTQAMVIVTIDKLMNPVAGSQSPMLNSPEWIQTLAGLSNVLTPLLGKPRSWPIAFPLAITVICASSFETLSNRWLSTIQSLSPKLKERSTRTQALQAVSALVWSALHRGVENAKSPKILDEIVKLVIPPPKKGITPGDLSYVAPLTRFIAIIGQYHPEFCLNNILLPLVRFETLSATRDGRLEISEPERLIVGIKGFLALLDTFQPSSASHVRFPSFDSRYDEKLPADLVLSKLIVLPGQRTRSDSLRSSRKAVDLAKLSPAVQKAYSEISDLLTILADRCNRLMGNSVQFEERLNQAATKTPINDTFAFGRKDESASSVNELQRTYFDLYATTVEALPRCVWNASSINPVVNGLCNAVAHDREIISRMAARSLKNLAACVNAQAVAMGFGKSLFGMRPRTNPNINDMLDESHVHNSIALYLDLLKIWLEEAEAKTVNGNKNTLDLTNSLPMVEELESHGIYLLCSTSAKLRSAGVEVLRYVRRFDGILAESTRRIIDVLEDDIRNSVDPDDPMLTIMEKGLLKTQRQRDSSDRSIRSLVDLCTSEQDYDVLLWIKIFPNCIHKICELPLTSIVLCRDIVLAKINSQLSRIEKIIEESGVPGAVPLEQSLSKNEFSPDYALIEQWKLYLVFRCATMSTSIIVEGDKIRSSKPKDAGTGEKLGSPKAIISFMTDKFSCPVGPVRQAVVTAIAALPHEFYKTLLESLQYVSMTLQDETKSAIPGHQRTASNSSQTAQAVRKRTELAHVYKMTAIHLRNPVILGDEWFLTHVTRCNDDLRLFLSDAEVQKNWDYQSLRRYYCGFLEELYSAIMRTEDPAKWMPFGPKKAAFDLLEDWCGFLPNQLSSNREDSMKSLVPREEAQRIQNLGQQLNRGERGPVVAAIEIQKRDLRTAALGAMAALCAGPLFHVVGDKTYWFDMGRILRWIDAIFVSTSDKLHGTGRRALKNLLISNSTEMVIVYYVLDLIWKVDLSPKAYESYIQVIYEVMSERHVTEIVFHRVVGAFMLLLGHEKAHIRTKAIRLLQILEQDAHRTSKLQDFEISVADRTAAVYRLAQFEICKRMSTTHSDQAALIFSQFAVQFKGLEPNFQRLVIPTILPWIKMIELEMDTENNLTQATYMVLANLLEITTKLGQVIHNEVQALWQSLATGIHAGNVQLVIDFLIYLCKDRREQNFIDYARQIVVFLAGTLAGERVVDFLLVQLKPSTIADTRQMISVDPPHDFVALPYTAELEGILPQGNQQAAYSHGQLCMILLTDLIVEPRRLEEHQIPGVLLVCLLMWDSLATYVNEQSRDLLVHLLHESVVSRYDEEDDCESRRQVGHLIEEIRRSGSEITWTYSDHKIAEDDPASMTVPPAMSTLIRSLLAAFGQFYPSLPQIWAKLSLSWAVNCEIYHVACRSFQIFRCLPPCYDKDMLNDLICRLPTTVSDSSLSVQNVTIENLAALKHVAPTLNEAVILAYPHLFWMLCACLESTNEPEYLETLEILDIFFSKTNLHNPSFIQKMDANRPTDFTIDFRGVFYLVCHGFKSANTLQASLRIVIKMLGSPASSLIGGDERLMICILAHAPFWMANIDGTRTRDYVTGEINILTAMSNVVEFRDLVSCLDKHATRKYRSSKVFIEDLLSALGQAYFPVKRGQALVFLIGLLVNPLKWFKLEVLQIISSFLPYLNFDAPDITMYGHGLLAPLIALLGTEFTSQALDILQRIGGVNFGSKDTSTQLQIAVLSQTNIDTAGDIGVDSPLYGVANESGWAIPQPQEHSRNAKENALAVFRLCRQTQLWEPRAKQPHEQSLSNEDSRTNGTFDEQQTTTASYVGDFLLGGSYVTQGSTTTLDILAELSAHDDFFAEDDEEEHVDSKHTSKSSATVMRDNTPTPTDSDENVEEYLTIRGYGRTPSRTDSDISATPQLTVDNSGTSTLRSSVLTAIHERNSVRSSSHSRSITSPSASMQNNFSSSYESLEDSMFSDDERSTGYQRRSIFGNAIRRAKSTSSKRSKNLGSNSMLELGAAGEEFGQGALLKGGGKERGAVSAMPGSPQVPKVPLEFLQVPRGE